MRQETQAFIKNIRDIYLVLGKNYTPYLKLAALENKEVELSDFFHPEQIKDYMGESRQLNTLTRISESESGLGFSETFDFRVSDQQKAYGTQNLIREVKREIRQLKDLHRSVNVISLGVGDGGTAQAYSPQLSLEHKDTLIGVDLHKNYLEKAKQKIPHLTGMNFDLNKLAQGCQLPIADHSMDIVECSMTAHHVENFSFLVAEAARILKKGASFIYLDLIDKTAKEEHMAFFNDHTYPSYHGVEFFRDHGTIKQMVGAHLSIYLYNRVGPGILFFAAMKA